MRKDEGDDAIRPFMNDRDLGSLLGVSKSTVSNQRQILVKERYGTGDPNDPITGDNAVDNAVAQVAGMENNAPTGETSETPEDSGESTDDSKTSESGESITRQDGGEQEGDKRAKGTEGINVPAGETSESDDGDGDEKSNKKAVKDQSAIDLRPAIDNVFSVRFDPDDRLEALNSISRQIEKARERMADKYNKKDHEMFKTYDEIYSACLSMIDAISNENEVLT